MLARRGVPCPENRTWPEHLAAVPIEDSAVRGFVETYEHARFGPAPTETEIAQLDHTLKVLEKT